MLDQVAVDERERLLGHGEESHRKAEDVASPFECLIHHRLERVNEASALWLDVGKRLELHLLEVVIDRRVTVRGHVGPAYSRRLMRLLPVTIIRVASTNARRAPPASSAETRRRMQATPRHNTKPEVALRSALHRLGLRYFVHRRPVTGLRREADVVFPRARVAVFLDSCFWHGCPDHVTWPVANAEWWRAKIERTRERDRDTDERLARAGWTSMRVWEHETPDEAAHRVAAAVSERLEHV